jgi:hypothetical protein
MKRPAESEWYTDLGEALAGAVRPVPAGWFSAKQIADKMGRSLRATTYFAHALVAEGSAEKKMFLSKADDGALRQVAHYRFKK